MSSKSLLLSWAIWAPSAAFYRNIIQMCTACCINILNQLTACLQSWTVMQIAIYTNTLHILHINIHKDRKKASLTLLLTFKVTSLVIVMTKVVSRRFHNRLYISPCQWTGVAGHVLFVAGGKIRDFQPTPETWFATRDGPLVKLSRPIFWYRCFRSFLCWS